VDNCKCQKCVGACDQVYTDYVKYSLEMTVKITSSTGCVNGAASNIEIMLNIFGCKMLKSHETESVVNPGRLVGRLNGRKTSQNTQPHGSRIPLIKNVCKVPQQCSVP